MALAGLGVHSRCLKNGSLSALFPTLCRRTAAPNIFKKAEVSLSPQGGDHGAHSSTQTVATFQRRCSRGWGGWRPRNILGGKGAGLRPSHDPALAALVRFRARFRSAAPDVRRLSAPP